MEARVGMGGMRDGLIRVLYLLGGEIAWIKLSLPLKTHLCFHQTKDAIVHCATGQARPNPAGLSAVVLL
jgi:hypothetical protein